MMGSLLSGGLALALSASIGKFLLKRFLGGFEAAAGDARAIRNHRAFALKIRTEVIVSGRS